MRQDKFGRFLAERAGRPKIVEKLPPRPQTLLAFDDLSRCRCILDLEALEHSWKLGEDYPDRRHR